MRLINVNTRRLEDFSTSEIPQYAILSHTWGSDEVTFQDMSSHSYSSKKGWGKIKSTCFLAKAHRLKYAWVDTCCIDKSSSTELTESINSMFQWYKNATICYVFLEDLAADDNVQDKLPECRWFTRGWTLQELLAPRQIEFYDEIWVFRGTKLDLVNHISTCTNIPKILLRGKISISEYSVAARMSWASRRKTTRVEDIAYCLLGIFDVNMPLIYGEGHKSFRRLQEEIVKHSNDLTIFAWETHAENLSSHLFASSPATFVDSFDFMPFRDDWPDFSVTNKGLLISNSAPLRTAIVKARVGVNRHRYVMYLGQTSRDRSMTGGGIVIRKMGPKLFFKDSHFPLAGFRMNELADEFSVETADFYILTEPTEADCTTTLSAFRKNALHVPQNNIFTLEDWVPEDLWDISDLVFLRPKPYSWIRYSMVLALSFHGNVWGASVDIVVLVRYDTEFHAPICKVFKRGDFPRSEAKLFRGGNRAESIDWAEFEADAPEILELGDYVDIKDARQKHRFAVSFEKGIVEHISKDKELFSLKITYS